MSDYEDTYDIVHGDVKKQFLTDDIKLDRHKKAFKNYKPVIFCVRCGSTTVDQNFGKELRCYECGTTLQWNNKKFSIRRGIEDFRLHDVETAFKVAREESNGK